MQRLINEIVERAKADRQRIVLPEGTEERTLKAANQILTDGVADLILLGNPDEINACATEWGLGNISKATIIDPENHPKKEEYAQLLCELRKKKGMTIEEARKLVLNPLYLALDGFCFCDFFLQIFNLLFHHFSGIVESCNSII